MIEILCLGPTGINESPPEELATSDANNDGNSGSVTSTGQSQVNAAIHSAEVMPAITMANEEGQSINDHLLVDSHHQQIINN